MFCSGRAPLAGQPRGIVVSQASSPGLASPVSSSSSSIANPFSNVADPRTHPPAPSPTRREGARGKAHTKSPHPHSFGGRGLTRQPVMPPPFALQRIPVAEPQLCALTGASRRWLHTARCWRFGFTGWLREVGRVGLWRRSQHMRRSLHHWRQPDISHHSRVRKLYHIMREPTSAKWEG